MFSCCRHRAATERTAEKYKCLQQLWLPKREGTHVSGEDCCKHLYFSAMVLHDEAHPSSKRMPPKVKSLIFKRLVPPPVRTQGVAKSLNMWRKRAYGHKFRPYFPEMQNKSYRHECCTKKATRMNRVAFFYGQKQSASFQSCGEPEPSSRERPWRKPCRQPWERRSLQEPSSREPSLQEPQRLRHPLRERSQLSLHGYDG